MRAAISSVAHDSGSLTPMVTFARLAFAASILGSALAPLPGVAQAPPPGGLLRVPVFAQVAEAEPEPDEGEAGSEIMEPEDNGDPAPDDEVAPLPPVEEVQLPDTEPGEPDGGSGSGGDDMAEYAGQLRQRAEVRQIHRAFGVATWGAMLGTVVLGFIQYHNLYGFFGGVEDTPCVQGSAFPSQDQCWGVPWPHRIGWITTTALYATTFTLSFLMPDPDDLSEGNSDFAATLSLHETLRWVHLGGMLAQIFLGLATSQNWFGIDRANNFAAQQALASVHQLVGIATFGFLTAAGAIMLF